MPKHTGRILAGGLIGLAVAVLLWQPWSNTQAQTDKRDGFASGKEAGDAKRDKFASGKPEDPNMLKLAIDGDRAMKYLKQLCDIGPRISGSDGMAKQQRLLIEHFEKLGGTTSKQEFTAKAKSKGIAVPMTNLIFTWKPEKAKRIILCSHYDTRPRADEEIDRTKWDRPFLSANDGTSGVALLMEIAHHLNDLKCNYGIDIVLFDGEEYIFEKTTQFQEGDMFFHGSLHFAEQYSKNRKKQAWDYECAVLFDLFAGKNARLAVEGYSGERAPALVNEIWKTAERLKSPYFKWERGFKRNPYVLDDHIQLLQVGIPAVDIIDFDYEHWHRLTDTPEQCSATTIADVGTVILTWLRNRP